MQCRGCHAAHALASSVCLSLRQESTNSKPTPMQMALMTAAVANGGQFTADTTLLLIHIVLGSIVSVMSGFLAALIAGENKRAPMVLGVVLLALGLLKAVMSWPYVPVWYHVIFTAILLPTTIMGGRLKAGSAQ